MKNSHFNKGDEVTITFNKKASSRTKGRIREHGPEFVVFQSIPGFRGPGALQDRPCALVGSLSTGWSGWLPFEEIEIA